jgi:hypothetical protein
VRLYSVPPAVCIFSVNVKFSSNMPYVSYCSLNRVCTIFLNFLCMPYIFNCLTQGRTSWTLNIVYWLQSSFKFGNTITSLTSHHALCCESKLLYLVGFCNTQFCPLAFFCCTNCWGYNPQPHFTVCLAWVMDDTTFKRSASDWAYSSLPAYTSKVLY